MANAAQVRPVLERGPRIDGLDSEEKIFALLQVSADPGPCIRLLLSCPFSKSVSAVAVVWRIQLSSVTVDPGSVNSQHNTTHGSVAVPGPYN